MCCGRPTKKTPARTLSLSASVAVLIADSCLHNATQSMCVKRQACARWTSSTDPVTGDNTHPEHHKPWMNASSWRLHQTKIPTPVPQAICLRLTACANLPPTIPKTASLLRYTAAQHQPACASQASIPLPRPADFARAAAALLCIWLVVLGPREDLLVLLRGGVPAAVALHAAQLQRAERVRVLAQRGQRRVQRRLERLRRARRERPPGARACARGARS